MDYSHSSGVVVGGGRGMDGTMGAIDAVPWGLMGIGYIH